MSIRSVAAFAILAALVPAWAAAESGARAAPVKNDFADSLQGGPDFWKVSGVGTKTLILYREPSTTSEKVGQFAEGTVLRNRGCRLVKSVRWCKVEEPTRKPVTGWVRGDRLRESAPPKDPQGVGPQFQAMGEISCATERGQPMRPCAFGVVRQGLGQAEVTVFLPGGGTRAIRFENGIPSGSDAPPDARLSFSKRDDLFLISINATRFEIPEAVINGG